VEASRGSLTGHKVEAGLQGADEGDPGSGDPEAPGHLLEEDPEAEHNAVDDEVAHEGGRDDDPAPASVRRHHHLHVALLDNFSRLNIPDVARVRASRPWRLRSSRARSSPAVGGRRPGGRGMPRGQLEESSGHAIRAAIGDKDGLTQNVCISLPIGHRVAKPIGTINRAPLPGRLDIPRTTFHPANFPRPRPWHLGSYYYHHCILTYLL
jgi:hypothetical protein